MTSDESVTYILISLFIKLGLRHLGFLLESNKTIHNKNYLYVIKSYIDVYYKCYIVITSLSYLKVLYFFPGKDLPNNCFYWINRKKDNNQQTQINVNIFLFFFVNIFLTWHFFTPLPKSYPVNRRFWKRATGDQGIRLTISFLFIEEGLLGPL